MHKDRPSSIFDTRKTLDLDDLDLAETLINVDLICQLHRMQMLSSFNLDLVCVFIFEFILDVSSGGILLGKTQGKKDY